MVLISKVNEVNQSLLFVRGTCWNSWNKSWKLSDQERQIAAITSILII